jgi:predicted RNA binding protein YcfA (HicA-like mRNA interferase family)
MPKKIRELKAMLRRVGYVQIAGGGKGSHTKWRHGNVARTITLSGSDGDDARPYQEKDIRNAIREAEGGGR